MSTKGALGPTTGASLDAKKGRAWHHVRPVLLLLFTIWSIVGLFRLHFAYDIDRFFAQDDPAVAEYGRYKALFGDEMDLLLVGLEIPEELDRKALLHIATLTTALDSLPFIKSVRSLTNFSEALKMPLGDWIKVPLFSPPYDDIARGEERLQSNEAVRGVFLSPQGNAAALVVELDSLRTKPERDHALSEIHRIVGSEGLPYHLAGRLATQAHYLRATSDQLGWLSAMALGLMVIVLFILFRCPITALSPLLISIVALIWTFGPLGWIGIGIEPLLSLLPALLLVLSSAFGIHIVSRFRDRVSEGATKQQAMRAALAETRKANLLSAISTAIGFGTLALYPIVPLQVFGVAAAWGLMGALIAARTILPLLTEQLSAPSARTRERSSDVSAARVFRRSRSIIIISLVVVAAGLFALPHLMVNNHFLDDLDRRSKLGIDATFFEEKFSGTRPLEIAVQPTDPDADMLDIEVLLATDSLVTATQRIFGIGRPLSYTDVVRATMYGLHQDHDLPTTEIERKRVRNALKYYARTNNTISLWDPLMHEVRITGRTPDMGSHAFRERTQELRPLMRNATITAHMTGGAWLMDLANQRISTLLVKSILIAVLLNALLVAWAKRSWRMGLISIAPNILPLAFAALIMWLFGLPLKVGTAMIFPILYGIALDDTMHFLLHVKEPTLRNTIRTWQIVRRPLRNTTIVISIGFALFAFSSFPSIAIFGAITAASMWIALAGDLWLLPLLVVLATPGVVRPAIKPY